MKNYTLKEKLSYLFDNMMSKGTIALVGMLFGATSAVVLLAAIALMVIGTEPTTLGGNIWQSIMYIIDAGTITGAETSDVGFLVIMSLVTLCGLLVTSILIGIITTGFEEKLNDLKKGNSRVIEKNHTVILGFDKNIYSLISELIIANENQKDGVIVILSEEEKETVETAVAEAIPDMKTTRIICRTGSVTDTYMLERCSLETCRSIIINQEEDFMTIKAILAINNYLKDFAGKIKMPHMVATLNEQSNYDAAKIVSEGNAELVLVGDAISRIIAQTCRQPGLSNVLIELFDYDGDELYFEDASTIAGKTFGQALNYYEKAVAFGLKRDGKVILNPTPDTVIEQDDEMLLLVEDDGMAKPVVKEVNVDSTLESNLVVDMKAENILILGLNEMVEQTIVELDEYFTKGSIITIANPVIDDKFKDLQEKLSNVELKLKECDILDRTNIEMLTDNAVHYVLLFSDDECDNETSDAKTLLTLIHLRDIAEISGKTFSITSEMKNVANQELAKVAKANDLVVGSNIINLILTQISENRDLAVVFQEILTSEGSEIYIRSAENYVKLDTEMDFYMVTSILAKRNEVAIGYKKQFEDGTFEVITNPLKSDKIKFTELDSIISLAFD